MKHRYLNKEVFMKGIFFLAACASILAVALICLFLFANGLPAIGKIGVFDFLLGQVWRPGNDLYGILPMILGSIYVTAGAIVVGVPIGILTAVFMAKFCPKKNLPFFKAGGRASGGYPVGRLRLFRTGSHRTPDPETFSRQQRHQYAGGLLVVGDYDSSYYYWGQ